MNNEDLLLHQTAQVVVLIVSDRYQLKLGMKNKSNKDFTQRMSMIPKKLSIIIFISHLVEVFMRKVELQDAEFYITQANSSHDYKMFLKLVGLIVPLAVVC